MDILRACASGDIATVRALLGKGALVNRAYDKRGGLTLLHAAAQYDRRDMARLLIDRGAEVNKATNDGCTPLHDASLR